MLEISQDIVERFVADGAKAIVIACNTATSAAAPTLRRAYPDLPIIGIEPALKPATEAPGHGRILVMATDITLRLDKYQELAATYGRDCEVISVPCPGLAGRIERGDLAAADLREMIRGYVGSLRRLRRPVVLAAPHHPCCARRLPRSWVVTCTSMTAVPGRPASCAIAWGSAAFWPMRPTRAP